MRSTPRTSSGIRCGATSFLKTPVAASTMCEPVDHIYDTPSVGLVPTSAYQSPTPDVAVSSPLLPTVSVLVKEPIYSNVPHESDYMEMRSPLLFPSADITVTQPQKSLVNDEYRPPSVLGSDVEGKFKTLFVCYSIKMCIFFCG